MQKRTKQRLALLGVLIILGLFLLTLIFLIMGHTPFAILTIAFNGFIAVVLYFTMRFYGHDQEDLHHIREEANQGQDEGQ